MSAVDRLRRLASVARRPGLAGRRARRLAPALVGLALTACLYHPPGTLPSSVRILYSRAKADSTGSATDVYFLVARRGNELRLTGEPGVDTQPVFAPTSLRVYYTREADGRSEIWSMEFDGSDERAVVADSTDGVRDPAISPDESRLAWTKTGDGRSEIWTSAMDGSDRRRVLEGSGWSDPAWSPDGRRLVVTGRLDGPERLYVVSATGGDPRALSPNGPAPQGDPDWSPDGSRIVFRLGADEGADIAVMTVATGAIERLVDNDVAERDPAWNPDGSRIVFVRRSEGKWNLWLMDADGSDVKDLTSSDEVDAADPEWL